MYHYHNINAPKEYNFQLQEQNNTHGIILIIYLVHVFGK